MQCAIAALLTLVVCAAAAGEGRSIELPGVQVEVWQEIDAGGEIVNYYTVAVDGRRRTTRTTYELLLRSGRRDPLAEPAPPALIEAPPLAEPVYIVQFFTQPLEAYRQALADLDGTIHKYLGRHAYLVRMTPDAAQQAAALPFVRWVGLYRPQDRLEPWLVVNAGNAQLVYPRLRYNVMVFEPAQKAAVAQRIAARGGAVNNADAGKFLLEATLTPDQLFEAAGWSEVQFIDRWGPIETDMNIARELSGADYLETETGFSGEDVRGEVIDVGFNLDHVDFQSQPLILHTSVGSDSHGASTSGIIFGDGTGNATGRGLLPDGQGIVADAGAVFANRYAHTGELLQEPYLAVFQSASVGSPTVTDYTTISAELDAILFDWDILHCQSQSNTGSQLSRPQAWAKNVVSVGGIRHMDTLTTDDDCWGCGQTAASIGPASDGRIKPDLAHFYDLIFTVTAGSPMSYTSTFGGTSGATPITAGHFGLFFQMWSEGVFGYPVNPDNSVFQNRPHMTTAKAMLINAASQWSFAGAGHDLTRVHQGWGRADVRNLYDLRNRMLIVNETDVLENLESAVYEVIVDPGEPALRATLAYADPPGVPASSRHRINDLTLRVTGPLGTVYWGNNGLDAANWSAPDGVANTVDTVENVFVEDPAAGTWTVEVLADEINEDGHTETPAVDADFALVVSGVQPVLPPMIVVLPDGAPDLVAPGVATDFAVEVIGGAEAAVPELSFLHYRFDPGDAFATVPLAHLGGIEFMATLPAAACDATPQFYVSAEGDGGSVVTDPPDAPVSFYETAVGTNVLIAADDFETDQGWTVEDDPGLATGSWERGIPINDNRGDPPTDFDGSGRCYVTGNTDDEDVDSGYTRLISPAFDLSGLDPEIHYALWYSNNFGSDPNNDLFITEVSNDDGANWVTAETIGPVAGGGWQLRSFRVADFVAPTSAVRVRFEASDFNLGSVVEAAVDAFSITRFECVDPCLADLDGDGEVGIDDFLIVVGAWGTPGGDATGDGETDIDDFLLVLSAWGPCDG